MRIINRAAGEKQKGRASGLVGHHVERWFFSCNKLRKQVGAAGGHGDTVAEMSKIQPHVLQAGVTADERNVVARTGTQTCPVVDGLQIGQQGENFAAAAGKPGQGFGGARFIEAGVFHGAAGEDVTILPGDKIEAVLVKNGGQGAGFGFIEQHLPAHRFEIALRQNVVEQFAAPCAAAQDVLLGMPLLAIGYQMADMFLGAVYVVDGGVFVQLDADVLARFA